MSVNPLNLPAIENEKVSPGLAVASIALSLAVTYHTNSIIKDGAMYQQLKLEGKDIKSSGVEDVIDIARQFEIHLLQSSERIAGIIIDAATEYMENDLTPSQSSRVGTLVYDAAMTRYGSIEYEQLALDLNITQDEVRELFDGSLPITDELCKDINRVFGIPVDHLKEVDEKFKRHMSSMFERNDPGVTDSPS